jgi:PAS domain S-box-containing protein
VSAPATAGPRLRIAPRHLAVAFGLFFAWSEVTQAWRGWGLAGLVFTYTGFIPLQIASSVSLFRASRRMALPEGARDALRLLGWAFVALAIGSGYLAVLAVQVAGEEARYTPADFFYLASYPLQIAALLFLPRAKQSREPRSRQVLDVAALLLTSAILVYAHRELRADWTGFAQFLATVYPVAALIGLLAANTALTRGLPIPSPRAWRTLVFAMSASLITDVIFQTLWATGYEGPNWSLPFGVGVNVAIIFAAHWYRTDPVRIDTDPMPGISLSPLPILLATGGAGVLLLLAVEGQMAAVQPVLITIILLNVLLATREFLVVMDATRIVRDETVRENERRFEALVRHSSDLVLTLDAEQMIRFASPALRTLLGRAPEQTVTRDLATFIHPEDRAGAYTAIAQLVPVPGSTASMVVRFQHASGEWRRFEWNATNLLEEPSVRAIVLNGRDVTERTRLEEQLRQAQKMEVVGQLAGGVAHDFNNLLTTVLTGSEVALQGLPADHELRPDLEGIRTAAQRGAALTSRLLAFSRPRGADPRVVRIGNRVEGAIPLMQRLLGDSYTIRTLITSSNGAALVEPDELEHALLNLVANSRDAMPSGGIVTVAVSERSLDAPLETPFLPVPAGRYVVIEVSDNGVGIDDETRERLFQPFFTTKATGHGTGLGLTGVFAFMRAANGGLTVQSTPGAGARFTLWFPAIAPGELTEPPLETNRVSRGSGTVLLVEDDDAVRLATRRILALGGYTVHEAGGPEEARRLFAEHRDALDLLVTDVMMPGENGADLANALREQKPGLRVLYVSGYPGEDLARLGRLSGEVELLRKPFTVRELTERVRDVLAR